ncbi:MAG: YkgJ family cysteine cluster protein [Ignavibacteria bacterium]
MKEKFFHKEYIDLTNLIQDEFQRNVELHGEKINCRKGCSQCCHQIFNITLADAYIIKEYLNSLPSEKKLELKERAKAYIEKFDPGDKAAEFFNKPKQACPALNESGECMIYYGRPVICRRFGPPVYDYKNPGKLFACVLNFKDGEEIIDSLLIPNQTQIGKKWDELKTEFNIKEGHDKNSGTTIAAAILNS